MPRLSSPNLEVARCDSCGTYAIDRPAACYRHERYEVPDDEWRERVQMAHARNILRLCAPHTPTAPRRLLDVGSATGALLQVAEGLGYECTGIELEPALAGASRRHGSFTVLQSPVEEAELPAEHFALVTMSHVLEHVTDPAGVMAAVGRALVPEGIAYVELPNAAFAAGQYIYRGRWNAVTAPGHHWVFSRASLERLIRPAGLEVVASYSWSAPRYSHGVRKLAKRALYWVSGRLGSHENLALVVRRPPS